MSTAHTEDHLYISKNRTLGYTTLQIGKRYEHKSLTPVLRDPGCGPSQRHPIDPSCSGNIRRPTARPRPQFARQMSSPDEGGWHEVGRSIDRRGSRRHPRSRRRVRRVAGIASWSPRVDGSSGSLASVYLHTKGKKYTKKQIML